MAKFMLCWVALSLFGIKTFFLVTYSALGTYFMNHLQREKKNLQELDAVFVFNVAEREHLDRPTARLIKEFDHLEGKS